MIGQKFGSLTVLESRQRAYKRTERPSGVGRTIRFWLVSCSCGSKPFEISDYKLHHGSQKCRSCNNFGNKNPRRSHGESGSGTRKNRSSESSEYRCWKTIKNRCYNPKFKQYVDYGGRGIRVCPRWLESYENFLADMGRKPDNSFSIQRLNNDGDYSPENCTWATDSEQRRNKRNTRWITIDGITKSRIEWLEELRVSASTFGWRKKRGWSDEEALYGKHETATK